MSYQNPNDTDTYSVFTLGTNEMSHGRITLENYDRVISINGGCKLEIEINKPSPNDALPKFSIIIRGGNWSVDKKISKTVKNCAAFRYNQLDLEIKGDVKNV
tara:strand:+ start:355 stop:660 length:306 start_codon:yes stop_codon:yes gene_type:complete